MLKTFYQAELGGQAMVNLTAFSLIHRVYTGPQFSGLGFRWLDYRRLECIVKCLRFRVLGCSLVHLDNA